jgi:hypothetical protein
MCQDTFATAELEAEMKVAPFTEESHDKFVGHVLREDARILPCGLGVVCCDDCSDNAVDTLCPAGCGGVHSGVYAQESITPDASPVAARASKRMKRMPRPKCARLLDFEGAAL